MNIIKVKENFINALKNNYDLKYEEKMVDEVFDIIGEYNLRNSKFVLSKKAEIYAFKNEEKIFIKHIESIEEVYLEKLKNKIEKDIGKLVNIDSEHMSTDLNFIFIVDKKIDENIQQCIKKFKYHKGFLFGLKGWVNVKLFIYDVNTETLYTNRFGKKSVKEMKKILCA
ncbi:hypothetical protein [Oceanirhabdus sp. W0125-5]|uniref:hypothetical protein n=1 Tax=Oceanirhabdus sp. W0125-5 TaxID=2999116 RepID=UPI0022F331F8|nr:hypothetical protein [Oceanirhabdus sp. W0125-5]WBW98270.1 hypothetical protein OW730_05740 [Oceanirhabdus sp. W0125-5]